MDVAEVALQHEPLTVLGFKGILVILRTLSTASGPESLSAVVDILEDVVKELEDNITLLDSRRGEVSSILHLNCNDWGVLKLH